MRQLQWWLVAVLCTAGVAAGQVEPERYIIELSGEPAAEKAQKLRPRRAVNQARRAAVRERQRRLRPLLESEQAEVLDAVDTVANAIIVRTRPDRLRRIAGLPGVARIHPVRQYKLVLDRAAPLLHVTDAWAQVGIENAGAGMKIGIIDTGIDNSHPAFQDASLPIPDGFPKVNRDTDLTYTNNKVIVARDYDTRDSGSARDVKGHGTAVAMVAAGVTNSGSYGTITGVAPKAYLGSYKVFPDSGESAPTDRILRALEDAVNDGMDVVNLSLGHLPAEQPNEDILVGAVDRTVEAGVIVVVAAGNDGPDLNTIGSPGTAPSAITVGNSFNDRVFTGQASILGFSTWAALPGSGANSAAPLRANLVDAASADPTGLLCGDVPAGAFDAKIVLILRGTCTFEEKLNSARNAGAAGALVYTDAERPEAIEMSVGAASLPASMVSHADGLEIKRLIAENSDLTITLIFDNLPMLVDANRLNSSSSRGPSSDFSVKPELLAVGTSIYTASPARGGVPRYAVVSGTSFSSPMVAGAAALLKSARPGLAAWQYKSLLVNGATVFNAGAAEAMPVQQAGAGLLDLSAALRGTAASTAASFSFGVSGSDVDSRSTFTLANVGNEAGEYSIEVMPLGGGIAPVVSPGRIQLEPGESKQLEIRFQAFGLPPGPSHGFVVVRGTNTDVEARLPYWHGVPSQVPYAITLFEPPATARPSARVRLLFRTTDSAGIPVTLEPRVTATDGGGSVLDLRSLDPSLPGVYRLEVRTSPENGRNVFHLQVGDKSKDVTITVN